MLHEKINAWLNRSGGYADGLALLKLTGFTGMALRVLDMGDDTYNQRRLTQELRTWLDAQPTTEAPKPTAGPKEDPPAVLSLRQQTFTLLDERSELKARIRTLIDADAQQARCDAAFRIKAITRELDELYSHLDFFKEHGYLPPADVAPELDDQAMLMNVRTYVSRYKKKLEKLTPSDEQYAPTLALLNQYEDQKRRLEDKLRK